MSAGTSARLQPAEIEVHWGKVSLADLLRLSRGYDYGVRGVFFAGMERRKAAAATRTAGAATQPGEWTFSAQARFAQIHRWDFE